MEFRIIKSALVMALSFGLIGVSTPAALAAEFDLSSQTGSMQVTEQHLGGSSAILNVGGAPRTVNVGDTLTAAEFVALQQIVSGGNQNLGLDAAGRAVSGNFAVHALSQSVLNNLAIPSGVTAIHDFGAANTLNVLGNLTNNGTLFAVSTNAATTIANIAASNIFNNANALLTSVLPANGLAGYQTAISGLNLNLTAINDIINAGTISSAGSLTATAGGSVANTGTAAVMQAIGNIGLNTANLVNAGLIASTNANLNIASAGNLTVNNAGGRLEALNGAINLRDALFTDKSNTTLLGGDWLATALNINSGNGKVNVNVGELVGTVNVNAGELHLAAASDSLTLGRMNLTGDPTFFNTSGDVLLTADILTNGFPLAIVAAGDITGTTISTIDTSSATGDSGAIIMVAGATFTSNPFAPGQADNQTGTTLEITGFTFGRIDFTGSSLSTITSNAGGTDLGAGNITLVALGDITLGNASVAADGDGIGTNGNIKAIVGSGFGDFTAGFMRAFGGTGGGDVELRAATPVISLTADPCNCVRIMPDGSIDPAAGEFLAGAANFGGSADPGPITAAGNITVAFPTLLAALFSGGDIIVESRILDLDADMSAGGDLFVAANSIHTHGSQIESRSPVGTVNISTEPDPSATLPRSLALTGGGFITGPGGINFTAGNGAVSFNDTFIMSGDVDIQALGPKGVVGAAPGGSVTGNGNIGITGVAFLNQSAFVAANELTFDMNLFQAPQGGGGTIANSLGDVNLMTNIVATGQNLTILAAGNVTAGPAFKLIDLSSKTTAGGSLNIVAGASFTPGTNGLVLDKTTVYEVLGPSASGGSVNLPNVMVVTSSSTKQGGDISINAFPSNTNPGSVKIGNLFADAKTTTQNGGNIQMYAHGGITTGRIDTTGSKGGDVKLATYSPALTGRIYFQNGTRGGAGTFTSQFADLPVAPGNISVGLIEADGLAKNGGTVELSSLGNISGGDIFATGVSAPLPTLFDDTPTAGGTIYITAGSGNVLLGRLDASGRGVNPTGKSGSGGVVDVFAASMNIKQISANGAGNVDDEAGDGGSVRLGSGYAGFARDGEILVSGAITATGGFSKNALCGKGGQVNIEAGTFRSTASGVSINASAGSPLQPDTDQGTVTIDTYGTQPVPVNFNTADATKTEFALPGGLFYLGQGAGTAAAGTGASVNGTNGDIVVGSYSGKSDANAKRVVDGSGVNVGSGKIVVTAHTSSQALTQPGTPSISVDGGTVGSARNKITPSQALALYQITRGETQTVNLNATGQATAGSAVNVEGSDIAKGFTNFVLNTADATPTITVGFTGQQVFLPLNNSKSNSINGTLNFAGDSFLTNSFATMELNDKLLTVQTGAQIIGDNDTAVTFKNAATINNNGAIRLNDLTLSNVGGKLVVNMDTNAVLGGPVGGAGDLFLNASTINVNGGSFVDSGVDLGPDAEGKADFVVANTKFSSSFLRSMSAKRISILSLSGMILPAPVTLTTTGLLGIAVNGALIVDGSTLTSGDRLSLTSFGNKIDIDSGSTLTSKKDMDITAGTDLTMSTNVSLLSTGGKMLLTANPTNGVIISIQDSLVAVGGVTLSANDVSVAQSSFNSSNINSIVNVSAKYANIVAQNMPGDSTLYLAKLTSTSPDGGMTIAVNGGDMRLLNDIAMPGANLTLIAEGDISGDKKVSLGVKTGDGGNLTMLAGMQPFGSPDLVTGKLTSIAVSTNPFSNGNIQLNNAIDTGSALAGNAGNITLYARNSDRFDGPSITANKVTANSKSLKLFGNYFAGNGGHIFIAGPGLLAFDGVESVGFPGGSVQIYGYNPEVTAPTTYFDGMRTGGTISLPIEGQFSQIQIAGNVSSKSTMPFGVAVTPAASNRGTSIDLWSAKEVKVTGVVMTDGASPITIQTIGGLVDIGKDLLAVGNVDVKTGGNISITGSTFVTVGGNISTVGGQGGGSGGNLTITTPVLPSTAHVGSILVKGFIATDGTSGNSLLDFGNGGNITIDTGTLQVMGTTTRSTSQPFPASIISAAGVTFGTPGTAGDIDIVTYGTQPVPLNFNPLSTMKTEIAMPGGIFEVGNSKVNGTKGGIISGSTQTYDAVSTSSAANRISSATFTSTGGDVVIATWIDSVAISQVGRAPGPPPNNYNVFADNGPGTPRNLLTPSEALAVYQASHNLPQTVNVNAAGQITVGSTFTAQQYEVLKPFSTFVVKSTSAFGGGLTLNIAGATPVLDLQKAGTITHESGIIFNTPGANANVLFGAKALNMQSFTFMESTGSISIFGKSGTWQMKGDISAPIINFHNTGGALTLDMGTGGTLHGFTVPTEVHFTGPAGVTVVGGNFRGATLNVDGPKFAKSVFIGKGTATKFSTSGFGDQSYVGDILTSGNIKLNINAGNLATTLNVGNGATIQSDSGDVTVGTQNDLTIGNNVDFSAHKLLQIANFGITNVGTGVEFSSGGNFSLVSNSDLNLGAGTTMTASGDMFVNSQQGNVNFGGSNTLLAGKSLLVSGVSIDSPGGSTSFTAHGDKKASAFSSFPQVRDPLQFSSTTGINFGGTNNSFVADKGNIGFYRFANGFSSISGDMFSGGKGGITFAAAGAVPGDVLSISSNNMNSTGPISVGGLPAIGTTPAQALGGNIVASGNWSSKGNVTLDTTGDVLVIADSSIRAGTLAPLAPNAGVLSSKNLATAGAIFIRGANVTLPFLTGDPVSLVSNGADLTVRATTGDITFGDLASAGDFRANGGSISMLAMGDITGGTGNNFVTRGVGTPTATLGGGLELAAGTQTSRLHDVFQLPAGSTPAPGSLGANVVINNQVRNEPTGAVWTPIGGGTVDLTVTPTNRTTLNLDRGAILIDAEFGSSVLLDGATFTTADYFPISHTTSILPPQTISGEMEEGEVAADIAHAFTQDREHRQTITAGANKSSAVFHSGSAFVNALTNLTVKTRFGDIAIKKGAMVALESAGDAVRVKSCSGPGHATVRLAGKNISLAPGQELLVTSHKPSTEQLAPADGVGRRLISQHSLMADLHIAVADISLVSFVQHADYLGKLRTSTSPVEKRMLSSLLKTAASIETVTRARGAYTAKPKKPGSQRKGNYTTAYAI